MTSERQNSIESQQTKADQISVLAIAALMISLIGLIGCGREPATRAMPVQTSSPKASAEQHGLAKVDSVEFNRESYDEIVENEFVAALQNPKSTFSIDVDTASYANVRRLLNLKMRPPCGAVRIEEMVNYFDYEYPQPETEHPFSVHLDLATCPWESEHQLLRVGLKGKEIKKKDRPDCNLVFLLDVSGSMQDENKLPLVQKSMKKLVKQLRKDDRVAIVVYAGASGVALDSTPIANKKKILDAIGSLEASGATNGAEGIHLAYQVATENFIEDGTNRVILCSDGDFNVGITNQSDLIDLIKEKAESDVFLSVFGFGTGNYNDSMMEKLADKGNGNYGYIDSSREATKVFVRDLAGNLITIAKDVKIQVDFNPRHVKAYRLIGYENRMLENEDFADDKKDAGEIGAGHTVTAFYEILPAGSESEAVRVDGASKFVKPVLSDDNLDVALAVGLRYKQPEADESQEFSVQLEADSRQAFEQTDSDFQFASAVVGMGMLLRDSKFAGAANFDWVVKTAKQNLGSDEHGYRAEFLQLARQARMLNGKTAERLSRR